MSEDPTQGPVIRDKRRIDPVTGQVRDARWSSSSDAAAPEEASPWRSGQDAGAWRSGSDSQASESGRGSYQSAYRPAEPATAQHKAPGSGREEQGPHDQGRYEQAHYDQAQYEATQYGGSQYEGAQYGGPQYKGAQYKGAQYEGAQYEGAQYEGAQYEGAQYEGAQYEGAQNQGAQYGGAQGPSPAASSSYAEQAAAAYGSHSAGAAGSVGQEWSYEQGGESPQQGPSHQAGTGDEQGSADEGPAPQSADAPGEAALRQALEERTADLQRLQAEYANYRRRVERDRAATKELALVNVLSNLLPLLDDIDRARQHGDLTGGFKSVGEALETTVEKLGLTRFGAAGEAFDPMVHEALTHTYSSEVAEATAVAVLQPGFRLGDRILRPARVAVAEPG